MYLALFGQSVTGTKQTETEILSKTSEEMHKSTGRFCSRVLIYD